MAKTPKRPAPKLDKRLTHVELTAELDAAEASIARGEFVTHAAVVRWAKSLGTAKPLPRPVPKKRPQRAS